jgi:hypothetical protein
MRGPSRSTTFSPDCRHVEEEVDDVVLEQVHLVDVEVSPVGAGEKAGLEGLFAARERPFDIERADDAVLGHAEGEVDDRGGALDDASRPYFGPLRAVLRPCGVDRAAFDLGDLRQERGQRPHGGGLARAAVAEDEHAADAGVDGGEDHRLLHLVLADDGGEGEGLSHAAILSGRGAAPSHVPVASRTRNRA